MADNGWLSALRYDPVTLLVESGDPAVCRFARRDLLDQEVDVTSLGELPLAQKILRNQQYDGSWKYPGGNIKIRTAENYNQLETFRNLGYLVQLFGFTRSHPAIEKAAAYLFGFQTDEGDIRGILGSQYTPYYTAAMTELLIQAGYGSDPRIVRVFAWLNSIRQNDGGWTIPLRTHGKKLDILTEDIPPLQPDRTKPASHLVTGVVLRAYAAHPDYRRSAEASAAGGLLAERLFKKDPYPDRSSPDYWLRFTYPFWFTDLLSALDSLSKIGFSKDDPRITEGLKWFIARQQPAGGWQLKTLKNEKKFNTGLWLDLSICRVIRRFFREGEK